MIFHYCPECGAASRYAPQPSTFPKWQEYNCGAKVIYDADWKETIEVSCRPRESVQKVSQNPIKTVLQTQGA